MRAGGHWPPGERRSDPPFARSCGGGGNGRDRSVTPCVSPAAQSGQLSIPPNGPWPVEGEPAAIHAPAGLPNPGEQVKAGIYAAKKTFPAVGRASAGA
jgi:hypothetical protein